MALHESVLEEFGLAPRWVRRGMGARAGSGCRAERRAAGHTGRRCGPRRERRLEPTAC